MRRLDPTIQSPLIDTINKRLLGIVSRHITLSLCVAQYLNSITEIDRDSSNSGHVYVLQAGHGHTVHTIVLRERKAMVTNLQPRETKDNRNKPNLPITRTHFAQILRDESNAHHPNTAANKIFTSQADAKFSVEN